MCKQVGTGGEKCQVCDKRISARMKGKVYKKVVRPTMLYGLETGTQEKTGGRAGGSRD